jgi:glutathione S-transferase
MTQTDTATLSLEMKRIFDAPRERVFDAWLSKDWGEWAGPAGIKGEVTLMEPRVGGRYRVVMHRPDGTAIAVGGAYREIDRPNRLTFGWKWEHEEQDTLITLTFRTVGGKTELTLRHEGFANTERRDSHNLGWNGTLDKLGGFLSA